ncbi:hypothetical protein Tco_0592068, partial [Tanacetum coccineum]
MPSLPPSPSSPQPPSTATLHSRTTIHTDATTPITPPSTSRHPHLRPIR